MNEQTTASIFTMLTLVLAFSGVQAEEFDSKEPLEEIVVYAQKREQGIQ